MVAHSDDAHARGGAIAIDAQAEGRADEARLVAQAQAGDLSAFEVLYRRNVSKVYGLCFHMCSDPSLAEELAQDAFVRAWEKLGSFRGESAFSSWLYPLAVNVALSERRARRRRTARIMATEDLTSLRCPRGRGRCSCSTMRTGTVTKRSRSCWAWPRAPRRRNCTGPGGSCARHWDDDLQSSH